MGVHVVFLFETKQAAFDVMSLRCNQHNDRRMVDDASFVIKAVDALNMDNLSHDFTEGGVFRTRNVIEVEIKHKIVAEDAPSPTGHNIIQDDVRSVRLRSLVTGLD